MLRLLTIPVLSLLLASCGFTPFMYQPDIVQGNLYDQDTVALIQPGMSRDEVHRLLGTPVLQNAFHANRDTYLYRYESGKNRRTFTRNLIIHYDLDGRVTRVDNPPLAVE